MLFISWFLHQTTTGSSGHIDFTGCLSLDSYIKPQHPREAQLHRLVVYLLIPTSNHNLGCWQSVRIALFISWFLHQTTTGNHISLNLSKLFISWFLHQTTTAALLIEQDKTLFISWFLHQTTTTVLPFFHNKALFISWFLHQTTTTSHQARLTRRCLSLDSYIKPQPRAHYARGGKGCLSLDSYIKPQLKVHITLMVLRCLSLDSYIKPQLSN